MKNPKKGAKPAGKSRLSLEQKLRLFARQYRIAERRRSLREGKRHSCSEFPRRCAFSLLVAVLILSVFSFAAKAANGISPFENANSAFASGNYHAAIEQYGAIIAHDGYSAPVLFNLGNAYYRDGQMGAAILNYERAQVLAPHDAAIAANLHLAREKAGVSIPVLSEFQTTARWLSPNSLAWIEWFALLAICLAIGLRLFFPRFSQSKVILGVAIILLLAIATTFAIRWPEFDRAIAVAPNMPARIAPADTAAELFTLKAGERVTVVKNYGQFVLIRTRDGRAGWASGKEIGLVE